MLDKKWIKIKCRTSPEYISGVDSFLMFACEPPRGGDRIRCPCNKCKNVVFNRPNDVRAHLFKNGFLESYIIWDLHGESFTELNEPSSSNYINDATKANNAIEDDYIGMVHNAFGFTDGTQYENFDVPEDHNPDARKFYELLNDGCTKIYPGCKLTKLAFVVKLMHMKSLNNWTNKSKDSLLQFIKEFMPTDAMILESYYELRKVIRDLGYGYVKIDACQNDCILYWQKHKNAQSCPVCGLSRWKVDRSKKKIPHKILRHFPLKPRLQKLFMSRSTAKDMRWHKEKRVDDGVLRHPADSIAWKSFDERHESFAADPRSVRLGLASDGFQPHGLMSIPHSIWPVVLMPYNLPPWMCMKQPYFMMTLVATGSKNEVATN